MTENTHVTEEQASAGEVVPRLSSQVSTLIRGELRLAQAEVAEKGKRAGVGAGLFGGAGIVTFLGLGAFVAAAILGLATALDAWLSALIVGAALLVVAGLLALTGKRNVSAASPPVPQGAIEELKADIQTVKESAGR